VAPNKLIWLKAVSKERPWLEERFLRRLVAERRIKFSKIGRRVYFKEEDLDASPFEMPARVPR